MSPKIIMLSTDNTAFFGSACKWNDKEGDSNGQWTGDERKRRHHTFPKFSFCSSWNL